MNSCIQNSCVKAKMKNIKKYFCYKNCFQRYKTLVSLNNLGQGDCY